MLTAALSSIAAAGDDSAGVRGAAARSTATVPPDAAVQWLYVSLIRPFLCMCSYRNASSEVP